VPIVAFTADAIVDNRERRTDVIGVGRLWYTGAS
jgi:hypothetical protein